MGDLFREAGDEDASDEANKPEEGQGDEERSLVDALLTAFRAASQGRGAQSDRVETEPPAPSPPTPEGEAPESSPKSASATEPDPGSSPVEAIEETMAAFRKAGRRGEETRAESPQEPPSEGKVSDGESSSEETPSAEESAPEETPGAATEPKKAVGSEEESDLDEDLAPAFRRVLSEQAGPQPGMPEEGGHGGEGDPPSGPAGPRKAPDPVSSPASDRPEATFLWVTGPTGEQSGIDQSDIDQPDLDQSDLDRPGELSVPVDRLSEPRAREADAFLLRGGGEGPYRLLCRIRGHPEAEIYLKPVFWRHAEGEQSLVSVHVDGKWEEGDRSSFGALREKAAAIHGRIGRLQEAGEVGDGGVELRVLRFVATRDQEFAPRRTEGRGDELVYPKLTPLLDEEHHGGGGELAEILSKTARRIRQRQ